MSINNDGPDGRGEPRFVTPPMGQEESEYSHRSKPGNQQEWSNLDNNSQSAALDPRNNEAERVSDNTNFRSISQVLNNDSQPIIEAPKKDQEKDEDKNSQSTLKNQETVSFEKISRAIGHKFEAYGDTYYFAYTSLGCFSGDNIIRRNLVQLVLWNRFDHFITFVILANSITLGMNDYSKRITKDEDYDSTWNDNLSIVGLIMSVIFMCECIFKIIAQGFCCHKNSYLRNAWNWLDFFVVLVSLLDFFPSLDQYSSLKVFRTLRILRPLRSINKIQRMKELINLLISSLPGLINVMFFLFFVASVFGILGIHQFSGAQYNRCRYSEEPFHTFAETNAYWPMDESFDRLCSSDLMCQEMIGNENRFCRAPIDAGLSRMIDGVEQDELIMYDIVGFEGYMKSMASIFQAITLEGWTNMMYNYSDADSPVMSIVYFGGLVIFGAFFALNLLLAQIMNSFYTQKATARQHAEKLARDEEKEKEYDSVLEGSQSDMEQKNNPKINVENLEGRSDSFIKIQAGSAVISPDTPDKAPDDNGLPTVQDNEGLLVIAPTNQDDQKTSNNMGMTFETNFGQRGEDERESQKSFSQIPIDIAPIKEIELQQIDPKSERDLISERKPDAEESIFSIHTDSDQEESVSGGEGEADDEKASRQQAENSNIFKRCLFNMVTHSFFNFIIFMLIIANTVVLACDGYPITLKASNNLAQLNNAFTIIFGTEMILKMIGLGLRNYLKDGYNSFDSVIVILSVIDWVLAESISPEDLGSAAEILKALKALRMLRVIKLARQIPDVQDILMTSYKSLKDVAMFSVLVILYTYICALLGMELFAHYCHFDQNGNLVTDYQAAADRGDTLLPPRANFDNIYKALTAVFILILGEDWPFVMYDFVRVYGESTLTAAGIQFYFFAVLSFGNLILLSLFTALLLENFEDPEKKERKEAEKLKAEAELSLVKMDTDIQQKLSYEVKIKLFWSKFKLKFVICFGTSHAKKLMKKNAKVYQQALIDNERTNDQKVHPEEQEEKEVPHFQLNFLSPTLQINSEEQSKDQEHGTEKKKSKKQLKKAGTLQIDDDSQRLDRVQEMKESIQKLGGTEEKQKSLKMSGILSPSNDSGASSPQNSNIRRDSIRDIFGGVGNKVSNALGDQVCDSPNSNNKIKAQSQSSLNKSNKSSNMAHINAIQRAITAKFAAENEEKMVLPGKALCCFTGKNKCRQKMYQMTNNKAFDWVIMFFIFASTILLCMESPMFDPESERMKILGYIDYVMTLIFVLEMLSKMIANGFLKNGEASYLKNPWNILDFCIVVFSCLSIILAQYVDMAYLKVFRMLRILRPLRLINRQKQLKLAITSLMKSIPDIVKLLIIVQFFIFLLGIFCQTLWAGTFWYCVTDHINYVQVDLILTSEDCLNYGGEWINKDFNYDNIVNSMLTLSSISSTEGWIDVMWSSVDANGRGNVPVVNKQEIYIIFYILLICIICLLFVNLFVGVVIETFNEEKEILLKNRFLRNDQRQFIQIQLLAYSAQPLVEIEVKGNWFKKLLIRVTQHPYFDLFITFCIIANTVLLGISHYGMNEDLKESFKLINNLFMVIFTCEAVMKISAMGCDYFRDSWNKFDFTVVVGTIVVLLISQFPEIGVDLSTQMTIGRVLRILRVLRIIKRAEQLNVIFETIVESLPAMSSLGGILVLFLFLFAIMGNQLFAFTMVETQLNLNAHANFQTFYSSFLLLFRCATGEAWNSIMFDTMRTNSITFQCDPDANYDSIMNDNNGVPNGCGQPYVACIYFMIFFYIVSQIFLNLFIAIVVDTFVAQADAQSMPVKARCVDLFIGCWKKYDVRATGYIHKDNLLDFMIDLHSTDSDFFKYSSSTICERQNMEYYIAQMGFPCHKEFQNFMFYDVLQLLCRNACATVAFFEICKQEDIADPIENLKKSITFSNMFRGVRLNEEQLQNEVFKQVQRASLDLFNENTAELNGGDENIDLVMQLTEASTTADIQAKSRTMTIWKNTEDPEYESKYENLPYTSKHLYLMKKYAKLWRENMHKEKENSIQKPKQSIDEWNVSSIEQKNSQETVTNTNKRQSRINKFNSFGKALSVSDTMQGMDPIKEEAPQQDEINAYQSQDYIQKVDNQKSRNNDNAPKNLTDQEAYDNHNASDILNEFPSIVESKDHVKDPALDTLEDEKR